MPFSTEREQDQPTGLGDKIVDVLDSICAVLELLADLANWG